MEAIESLKKMIRSWLDDTFPLMAEAKRAELSEAMDVTLVEQQKVESMKTFFEINNVIRMSFIEMQYMKKVRPQLAIGAHHLPSRVLTLEPCRNC